MKYARKKETADFIRDVVHNGRTVVPAVVVVDLLNDALKRINILEEFINDTLHHAGKL